MFLRIDTDTFVNVNLIGSFKLQDEGDYYKLFLFGQSGNVLYTIVYPKESPAYMGLLREVNDFFRSKLINPDIILVPNIEEKEGE